MNLKAINAELAKIGYKATKLPKAKRESWTPKTAAGRACKARMAFWARQPKPRGSILAQLLGMFGAKLGQVQPWPECGPGNYGRVLVNALPRMVPHGLPDFGRMADGRPVNVVLGRAAAPITRIVCE